MDTQLMLVVGIIVLVLILVAVGFWAYAKMTRSRRLKAKFGPEYDHTVARLRNRELAETELQDRERRVKGFHIVPYQWRMTSSTERAGLQHRVILWMIPGVPSKRRIDWFTK